MHLKIVNKNLPQKITTLSRFLQWTIVSVKTNPLNDFTEKVLAKQGIVQQSSVHQSVEDKCFKVLLIHNIYDI